MTQEPTLKIWCGTFLTEEAPAIFRLAAPQDWKEMVFCVIRNAGEITEALAQGAGNDAPGDSTMLQSRVRNPIHMEGVQGVLPTAPMEWNAMAYFAIRNAERAIQALAPFVGSHAVVGDVMILSTVVSQLLMAAEQDVLLALGVLGVPGAQDADGADAQGALDALDAQTARLHAATATRT